ncbi:MAG TPA: thiamine pyrophosphate-binding protein [Candidatus Dormibacteraeota bacterium]|nr:thiamine pyrophosphate-binding protein [Candidatus Dormibacteraeota bacterium]
MIAGHVMARHLRDHGVPWVAGVSGESFLPLLDGLRVEEIPFLSTCHEAGAAFLACGYARASGRPGVVAVTRGPGASNALIGVHEAFQAHLPLVVIVGQLESRVRGRGAMQEMEFTDVFRSAAKAVFEVTSPAQAPAALLAALRKAQADLPGPVVVSIPADHFYGEIPEPEPLSLPGRLCVGGALAPASVELVDAAIAASRRAVLICGAAFAGRAAAEHLGFVAERRGLAVIGGHAFPDVLAPDHPSWLGCSTIRGPRALAETLEQADLVLMLGQRLGDRVTQGYRPLRGRIIAIDVATDVGWDEYPSAEFLLADPMRALEQLVRHTAEDPADDDLHRPERTSWVAARRKAIRAEGDRVLEADAREAAGVPFARIVAALDAALPADAVVVSDAGSFNDWITRYLAFRDERRYVGPISGAMGFALPAALGAQLALGPSRSVALVGDGAFLMTGLELATAARLAQPLTVVVFKNGIWGSIALHQDLRFPGRRFAVDLPRPSYAALAESLGARGFAASTTDAFVEALAAALAVEGPSLVEVTTDARRPSPSSYAVR